MKPLLLTIKILFSMFGLFIGLFFFFKPTLAIEIQRRFYEKINWRIEPISISKEIRNTKMMGLFLIIIVLLAITYVAAFAQEPEVQELQQKEYFKELSTDVYDQVLDRLELEEERRSKSDEKTDATTQASPKIVTELGVVYVGMPKEELEKAGYTELTQKGYRKEGNEEWVIFSNWTTEEPDDLFTFYVEDGKIKGWKEK